MARAKLPKELIKKYGISKKAWAVFRGRNAGKKVKKVRRVKVSSRRRAAKRQPSRTVRHMARRRAKRKSGRKTSHTINVATILVFIHMLRELGILDMALNSLGTGSNIIDEAKAWVEKVEVGDFVDAVIPAGILMLVRKFLPSGPRANFGGIQIRAW